MKRILGFAVSVLSSASVWAQVFPIPIPGGDVLGPPGPVALFNAFSPGPVELGFDGINADPHVITNFSGVVAMGYSIGPAFDNKGVAYQVVTDIRVYRGDYNGAQFTYPSGGTTHARAHGTFVEI